MSSHISYKLKAISPSKLICWLSDSNYQNNAIHLNYIFKYVGSFLKLNQELVFIILMDIYVKYVQGGPRLFCLITSPRLRIIELN